MKYPLGRSADVETGHLSLIFAPPLASEILELDVRRGGRIHAAHREALPAAEPYPDGTVLIEPITTRPPIRWQGLVHLREDTDIDQDLFVEAGTTILFDPGVSLILEGRIVAVGEKERPIQFIPAHEGQEPWGVVGLRGSLADRSIFRHCVFRGGSGKKDDLAEYSAMLSIHDVDDVTISHSTFLDSQIVDDMLHTVYSDLVIEHSSFENAPFDAVDLDMSRAIVRNCRFRANGNDALDLMSAEVAVISSDIAGSGDKGISVGEASRLWAIDNTIHENLIGVEVKDTSLALLANNTLRGNNQALHAYRKNWRYGSGGTIRLVNSRIENHPKPIGIEARSDLWVLDSSIDEVLETGKRVEILESSKLPPSLSRHWSKMRDDPDETWGATEFLRPFWAHFRAGDRGARTVVD